MLIATWNVNSLKARMPRVTAWVEENQPEILCMQETKMKQEVLDRKSTRLNSSH